MAEKPIHADNGLITREGMTRALLEGGSVLWTHPKTGQKQLITEHRQIPKASAFVQAGDTAGAALTRADLLAQKAALEAEIAALPDDAPDKVEPDAPKAPEKDAEPEKPEPETPARAIPANRQGRV